MYFFLLMINISCFSTGNRGYTELIVTLTDINDNSPHFVDVGADGLLHGYVMEFENSGSFKKMLAQHLDQLRFERTMCVINKNQINGM